MKDEKLIFLVNKIKESLEIHGNGVHSKPYFNAIIQNNTYRYLAKTTQQKNGNSIIIADFSENGTLESVSHMQWEGMILTRIGGNLKTGEFYYVKEKHSFSETGKLRVEILDNAPETISPDSYQSYIANIGQLRTTPKRQFLRTGIGLGLLAILIGIGKCSQSQNAAPRQPLETPALITKGKSSNTTQINQENVHQ